MGVMGQTHHSLFYPYMGVMTMIVFLAMVTVLLSLIVFDWIEEAIIKQNKRDIEELMHELREKRERKKKRDERWSD